MRRTMAVVALLAFSSCAKRVGASGEPELAVHYDGNVPIFDWSLPSGAVPFSLSVYAVVDGALGGDCARNDLESRYRWSLTAAIPEEGFAAPVAYGVTPPGAVAKQGVVGLHAGCRYHAQLLYAQGLVALEVVSTEFQPRATFSREDERAADAKLTRRPVEHAYSEEVADSSPALLAQLAGEYLLVVDHADGQGVQPEARLLLRADGTFEGTELRVSDGEISTTQARGRFTARPGVIRFVTRTVVWPYRTANVDPEGALVFEGRHRFRRK